jgi:hypothetical protein
VTTSEFDLEILFIFFGVRRIDLEIFFLFVVYEGVLEFLFGGVKGFAHVLVELTSEFVAIVDTEYSFEEVDVICDIEIFPCVVVLKLTNDLGDLLTLDEDSLWYA